MPKEPSTSCRYCLAFRVSARGKIMFFPCAGCRRNRMFCMFNVMFGRCGCCLEKNLKYSLVIIQGDCKRSHKISYFPCSWVFLGNRVDQQKLSL